MVDLPLPLSLKRLLPRIIMEALRERKLMGRVLLPHIPRQAAFEQSLEDVNASASMAIIVAIRDAAEVTELCLASVEKYASEAEIILVDDGSSLAETLEVIRLFSARNKWKVVRHEKPLGHSEACRAGATLATRPYLCLLNSDTVVTPWCWRRVKEVFEDWPQIGVAGPSTSYSGNSQALTFATALSSYWNEEQICSFANLLLTRCQVPTVTDLDWIAGFAFFIRRGLWEKVGGFDQKLSDYGNEIELCGRVAREGYRMVWIRNAYIHHFGKQSYKGYGWQRRRPQRRVEPPKSLLGRL